MADRYPREVEFYVPQLCTYLFHFTMGGDRDSFQLMDSSMVNGEESKQENDTTVSTDNGHRRLLKEFILERSAKSTQFAHLVFWYLIAGIDDSESIQMSQHNNKELWAFLKELLDICEESMSG